MAAVDTTSCCTVGHSHVIPIETARRRALDHVRTVVGTERVLLAAARGRVTASPVLSGHALPPFDQSAMDGYAVRTGDVAEHSQGIPVVGRRAAGAVTGAIVVEGPAAVRIFTGAAVPEGFDAVVMQENCTRNGASVTVLKWPDLGEHIRPAGNDVREGEVIVQADTLIDARYMAILAAAGVSSVLVRRRVRVGVLSTGDELREPNEPLRRGEIHDSNRAMVLSLVAESSIETSDLGRIEDDPARIADALRSAARDFDVLISTGGVSVGEEDHMGAAVRKAGGTLDWLGTSIKPGKPASVGRLAHANLIALPGNPVSALVTFLWFGRPILRRRMGLHAADPLPVSARAGFDELRKAGRDEFIPVAIDGRDNDGCPVVAKRRPAGSAQLSSLLDADGFARISADRSRVARGDAIDFYPFSTAFSLF